MLAKESCAAGPLRSTGVTPLHSYYGPSRHRLVFGRFPGTAGYTAYLAPPISRWDEDGFSSCSACPCHRATPTTPPERHVASVRLRRAVLPSSPTSGLGLRSLFVTGPPVGSLSLRPGDSLTIPRMALSIGFMNFVSSTHAIQATGRWFLPRWVYLPLNRPAFAGHTMVYLFRSHNPSSLQPLAPEIAQNSHRRPSRSLTIVEFEYPPRRSRHSTLPTSLARLRR
jgi:hypothetical protein